MLHKLKGIIIATAIGGLTLATGTAMAAGHANSKHYDRGCSDAKIGSYDRSKHSAEYEQGWQDCNSAKNSANTSDTSPSAWDRGCSDAKVGSYDRSSHSQAYEDGWNACHNSAGDQTGAQNHGGLETAKKACIFQFGQSGHVQTVTDLKPGFWEIIVSDKSRRKVACTVDAQGNVSDWVEM